MTKIIKILLGLLLSPLILYSQNAAGNLYTYKAPHYYESIDLLEDGSFVYYCKSEFLKSEIEGNWQLRNDTILVLDSKPQRSKIVVFESRKRAKRNTFQIRSTDNRMINYHLYLITPTEDTLEFKDQFDKTVVSGNFSSFYVVDTKGQYSPTYEIVGSKANFFEILIEGKRVFENEYWKYYGEYIIPLGTDGKYSNYKLVKTPTTLQEAAINVAIEDFSTKSKLPTRYVIKEGKCKNDLSKYKRVVTNIGLGYYKPPVLRCKNR